MSGAYVDVAYAAIAVVAIALALDHPRRGPVTLALLAVAG
jgi:hypothetical protein